MPELLSEYNFKPYPEAFYAALTALTIFVLETGANFDTAVLDDWKAWGISLGGAAARAVAAAALNAFLNARRSL